MMVALGVLVGAVVVFVVIRRRSRRGQSADALTDALHEGVVPRSPVPYRLRAWKGRWWL